MNRYEQWVHEGSDYFQGLAMLNQVPGMHHLKRQLLRKQNKYNRNKLNSMLSKHLVRFPATEAAPQSSTAEPPLVRQALKEVNAPPVAGPPRPFSTSAFEPIPYEKLPTVLQGHRTRNVERYQERRKLHEQLKAGITSDDDRLATCRRIAELSDMITAAWQIEDDYKSSGALPIDHETELRSELEKLNSGQLQRRLTNRVRPMVSRNKARLAKVDAADHEGQRKYQMRYDRALLEKSIIQELLNE